MGVINQFKNILETYRRRKRYDLAEAMASEGRTPEEISCAVNPKREVGDVDIFSYKGLMQLTGL